MKNAVPCRMRCGELYVTTHWCWQRSCTLHQSAQWDAPVYDDRLMSGIIFMAIDKHNANKFEHTVLLPNGNIVNIVGSVGTPLQKCFEAVQ